MTQGLLIQKITLGILHRRVTNHTCCPTNQHYWSVTRHLKVLKHHHPYQVIYMQRIGSWVYTNVSRCHFPGQQFICSRHDIMDHAPPFEFFNKIHENYSSSITYKIRRKDIKNHLSCYTIHLRFIVRNQVIKIDIEQTQSSRSKLPKWLVKY